MCLVPRGPLAARGWFAKQVWLTFVWAFHTNPSTSYHHDSYWTVQVQCFFRQTSGKFSLSSHQGLEGTKRSDSVQPHVGPAPWTCCCRGSQQHCWCVCLMPSLMGACLLNGPIISMSHGKQNMCKSHCSMVNALSLITKMQSSYKHITNVKSRGSYKRLIYPSNIISFSSTEATFPEIINQSILGFIKRLVMSTRIVIRWLSEGHPLSNGKTLKVYLGSLLLLSLDTYVHACENISIFRAGCWACAYEKEQSSTLLQRHC